MACTKNGHEALIEVYRHAGAASDAVTRWCGSCGSVVVDEDYDGRTDPGTYFAMRTPRSTVERDALKAQLVERDAEIGRLRATLRIYANEYNWNDAPGMPIRARCFGPPDQHGYETAREALAPVAEDSARKEGT